MKLSSRILLGYVALLGLSAWLLLYTAIDNLKPAMRQSAEETLVDTANLLAALVADEVRLGTIGSSSFASKLQHYAALTFDARIFGVDKVRPNHRIYVTNINGRVIFDSSGVDVGADYSRWNDVYLTLRGRYGARSTPAVPGDDSTSVMYVAAPVRDGERIIGSLTVAKPNLSMQPFIERTRRTIVLGGIAILGAALLASTAVAWWTTRSVRELAAYARSVTADDDRVPPTPAEPELAELAAALEQMRARLDGKAYIEQYVQTLTHELKSPLAAIIGASELLRDELSTTERARFLDNIEGEAGRILQVAERLLDLAQIEQRHALTERVPVAVAEVIGRLLAAEEARLRAQQIEVDNRVGDEVIVRGERFLLQQAFANLLDNALAFTPHGGRLRITATRHADNDWSVVLYNNGPAIPDYALPRLTERFFSLPRPATGRKSSGLGLAFVAEVAALHGGSIHITNDPDGGVNATFHVPA